MRFAVVSVRAALMGLGALGAAAVACTPFDFDPGDGTQNGSSSSGGESSSSGGGTSSSGGGSGTSSSGGGNASSSGGVDTKPRTCRLTSDRDTVYNLWTEQDRGVFVLPSSGKIVWEENIGLRLAESEQGAFATCKDDRSTCSEDQDPVRDNCRLSNRAFTIRLRFAEFSGPSDSVEFSPARYKVGDQWYRVVVRPVQSEFVVRIERSSTADGVAAAVTGETRASALDTIQVRYKWENTVGHQHCVWLGDVAESAKGCGDIGSNATLETLQVGCGRMADNQGCAAVSFDLTSFAIGGGGSN